MSTHRSLLCRAPWPRPLGKTGEWANFFQLSELRQGFVDTHVRAFLVGVPQAIAEATPPSCRVPLSRANAARIHSQMSDDAALAESYIGVQTDELAVEDCEVADEAEEEDDEKQKAEEA